MSASIQFRCFASRWFSPFTATIVSPRLGVSVQEMDGECYIHRTNCEFTGYADEILKQKCVTCNPVYWSDRDDWTLAMVAAGLGFTFMPANSIEPPGVIGLPVVEREFWREVGLVSVRRRPHSSGLGSLVREAMRKTWFEKPSKRILNSEDARACERRQRGCIRRRLSDRRRCKDDAVAAAFPAKSVCAGSLKRFSASQPDAH